MEQNKNRCVIIGGAPIENYKRAAALLDAEDCLIYCDSGLMHREFLGRKPDLIVGDFDSWKDCSIHKKNRTEQELQSFDIHNYLEDDPDQTIYEYATGEYAPMMILPPEKYDTDTLFGVREGLRRGFEEFLLLGTVGKRFDHTFANISILLMLDSMGKKGVMADDYSLMEVVSRNTGYVEDTFAYFSLLNISGEAKEITIRDAKYTFVPNGEITSELQFGISNEVLPGHKAQIRVGKGRVLLVKIFGEQ